MKFLGIQNRYDIVEMSRDELVATVHLMNYVANNPIEKMPCPNAFDDLDDPKIFYAGFSNALAQMDKAQPEIQTLPADLSDFEKVFLLSANEQNVKIAINHIGYIMLAFAHFNRFYYIGYWDNHDKVPDINTIKKMDDEWGNMIKQSIAYKETGGVK